MLVTSSSDMNALGLGLGGNGVLIADWYTLKDGDICPALNPLNAMAIESREECGRFCVCTVRGGEG